MGRKDPPSSGSKGPRVPEKPVIQGSTKQRIAEHLRRRIRTGSLKPGERIIELDMAEALGVSRGSVREALLSLAREGFVTIIPYRGAIVPMLDSRRFKALQEFRIVLEEFAVSRLTSIGDTNDFRRLEHGVSLIRKHLAAADIAAAIEADLKVHELLVQLAQNPFLSRSYSELLNEFRLYIRLTYSYSEDLDAVADEHDAVILAMSKGREAKARAIIRTHIERGFDKALEKVETTQALATKPVRKALAKQTVH
jgi:DNA-binding GntR family transcriptional regulator